MYINVCIHIHTYKYIHSENRTLFEFSPDQTYTLFWHVSFQTVLVADLQKETYIYIYIYIYIRKHKDTHTYTHTYIRTHTHTLSLSLSHPHPYTQVVGSCHSTCGECTNVFIYIMYECIYILSEKLREVTNCPKHSKITCYFSLSTRKVEK